MKNIIKTVFLITLLCAPAQAEPQRMVSFSGNIPAPMAEFRQVVTDVLKHRPHTLAEIQALGFDCVANTVGFIYYNSSDEVYYFCSDNAGSPTWEQFGGGEWEYDSLNDAIYPDHVDEETDTTHIGVGTTLPLQKLHIVSDAGVTAIRLEDTNIVTNSDSIWEMRANDALANYDGSFADSFSIYGGSSTGLLKNSLIVTSSGNIIVADNISALPTAPFNTGTKLTVQKNTNVITPQAQVNSDVLPLAIVNSTDTVNQGTGLGFTVDANDGTPSAAIIGRRINNHSMSMHFATDNGLNTDLPVRMTITEAGSVGIGKINVLPDYNLLVKGKTGLPARIMLEAGSPSLDELGYIWFARDGSQEVSSIRSLNNGSIYFRKPGATPSSPTYNIEFNAVANGLPTIRLYKEDVNDRPYEYIATSLDNIRFLRGIVTSIGTLSNATESEADSTGNKCTGADFRGVRTGTGQYTVYMENKCSFFSTPIPVVTPLTTPGTAVLARITDLTHTYFSVETFNLSNTLVDSAFTFIVAGPR